MTEITRRCEKIKADITSWVEFVRELNISKLTDSEIDDICGVIMFQEVLGRGARIQALFIEAGRRIQEKDPDRGIPEHAFKEPSSSPKVVDVVEVPVTPPAHKAPDVTPKVSEEAPKVSEEAPNAPCVACGGTGVSSSGKTCRACVKELSTPTSKSEPLFDFLVVGEMHDKQVLTVDAPQKQTPQEQALPEQPKKKKRGRPCKSAKAPEQAQEQVQEQAQEQVQEQAQEQAQEAEANVWAKERIRPDVLATPFNEVETVDYFCGSILCDAPLCGRDNTIVRIPKEPVDQCYVQYRCSDCGERGQVLYNREELEAVIAEDRRVDYDVLIANQPKFAKAFEQAKIEVLTPRDREIKVPRNPPKLLPRPVAKSVPMTPIEEPQKEYVPDVSNDLDGIESTEDVKQIVGDVLNKAAPMAANLEVAEQELTASLLSMNRSLLVSQWEGLTGQTWSEAQDVEQAAREVVRSILNLKGDR